MFVFGPAFVPDGVRWIKMTPDGREPLGTGPPQDAERFTRVYSVAAPGVTPPVPVRLGRFEYFPTLGSLNAASGGVELEITVGDDGRVRDAMVLKPGGAQVDALAVRAAANSLFQAGKLDGQAVAVRMQLELRPTSR